MSATHPALPSNLPLRAGMWLVDTPASSVEFRVKHLGLATVQGRFGEFDGTLEIVADGAHGGGSVALDSVDSGDALRDEHLRDAGFFDTRRHPRMAFSSRAVRALGAERVEIAGELGLHGVTAPMTLDARIEPDAAAGREERVRVSARAQISRAAFGLRFHAAGGAGDVTVGDTVKIALELSLVRVA